MRSQARTSGGRRHRALATALLLTLPVSVAACSDDSPVEEIEKKDTD